MGSYRKNLMLSLGLLTAQVDLHAVAESTRSPLHMYCGKHHTRLKQQYICTTDQKVVDEPVRGAEGPDTIKVVEPSNKPGFVKDEKFELIPVAAKDLNAHTYTAGGFYYCQPSSAATAEAWKLIHDVLKKGKVGFITQGTVRNGDKKLWRLVAFNDYLVLAELRYPSDVRPTPSPVDAKPSRELSKLMNQLVEQSTQQWDDIDTDNPNTARFNEWLAGATIVPRTDAKTPEAPTTNMMDALRESIEATKK